VQSAISAGLFQQAMEKLMISKAQDRKDKEFEFKAKQLMEEPLMDTPPPLKHVPWLGAAGGAMKRTTFEVGGFGAEMFSQKKIPRELPGGYHSNTTYEDGEWSKSDADHPDKKVAGDKDACCKGEAYHPDEKVAGLVDMFSSESSPGAGTPSTEDSCAGGYQVRRRRRHVLSLCTVLSAHMDATSGYVMARERAVILRSRSLP
jgi:hypothetical protein